MLGTGPLKLFPVREALRGYSLGLFRLDVQAGLTVAVFAVPQTMAYAMLTGVPPVYGLYAAAVMSIIAALWGHSPYLNTGPSNSAALLASAALLPFAGQHHFMSIVFLFTLMVGIIRLLMGVLRLGTLVDYVPESAFLGFTIGAGILIVFGQLHHLFGVPAPDGAWFIVKINSLVHEAPQVHGPTLAVGLGSLAVMVVLNRYRKRFPVALLAMVLAAAAAHLSGADSGIRLVRDIVPVPRGLPSFHMPLMDIEVMHTLLPGALAVSIIGLIEAVSIAQTLALKHRKLLNFNQEFFGQGLSHIVSAFFQGIPGSGSFGRTFLMEQSGAKTALANVFFGIFIACALVTVPGLLELIPVSALAGLLFFVGWRLVDVKRIRRVLAASRPDAVIMTVTLLVTVFYRIEYGIFAGIVGGALYHLHQSSRLHLSEVLPGPKGRFEERVYDGRDQHEPGDVVVLTVGGDLFYAVSIALRRQLNMIVQQQNPSVVVLRVRRVYSIDYSCWSAIFDFAKSFQEGGGEFYLCGVNESFEKTVRNTRMEHVVPREHIFPSGRVPWKAVSTCLAAVFRDLPANAKLSNDWKNYRDWLKQLGRV